MFLRVCYNVKIGNYTFRNASFQSVSEISVSRSIDKLTSTCKIKLPRTTGLQKKSIASFFKVGDPVTVKTGYDNRLKTVFVGYITKISPKTPLEFECEDEMWKLKQIKLNENVPAGGLQNLLKKLWSGKTEAYDVQLPPLRIENTNGGEILEKITKEYGIRFFFRLDGDAPVLVAGRLFKSGRDNPNTAFHFQKNITQNDLEFTKTEDVKICLKAVNKRRDGKEDKATVGDEGGAERTRIYYDTPDFKKLAEQELESYRFTGYRGSFTAFGFAMPQPDETVELGDYQYPERKGKYYVDEAELTVNSGGMRVKIKLGKKAI